METKLLVIITAHIELTFDSPSNILSICIDSADFSGVCSNFVLLKM